MKEPRSPSLHKPRVPRPLETGDTIGIVAASGPADEAMLGEGERFLREQGFLVREGCHVRQRTGYLAGTDAQRCDDLNAMLADPSVRAVFLARGGYGVMRVLDSLDLAAVRADPKLLVGMSDVTALQLSLYARCELVSLAGPMVAGQIGEGLDELSRESLTRCATETLDGQDLACGLSGTMKTLRGGRAVGPILGGCLSLVTALLGTRHSPEYRNAILLLEDVNEPAYRVDRMLTQLKLAGILDAVAGVVLGHFLDSGGIDVTPEIEPIVMELTAQNNMPVISGFPHGHTLPNVTVPIGMTVELDTSGPSLRIAGRV